MIQKRKTVKIPCVLMVKTIYSLTMLRSRKALIRKYGVDFWNRFRVHAKEKLGLILPLTPDIGKSIFGHLPDGLSVCPSDEQRV